VPVFMAGIYFSWVILLFGAQVAYAFQNRKLFLQDKIVDNVNQRGREFVALRLMTCICRRFFLGQKPVSAQELSDEMGIPMKLAQQVLRTLVVTKLVVEIAGDEAGCLPARPLDAISAHDILTAMRSGVGHELVSRDEPMRAEIYGEFARIEEAERAAASTVTMLALASRAPQIKIFAPPENKK
jgi:membrane protein